jgi:hypothetical protein
MQVIDVGEGKHQPPKLGGREAETPPDSRKRGSPLGWGLQMETHPSHKRGRGMEGMTCPIPPHFSFKYLNVVSAI